MDGGQAGRADRQVLDGEPARGQTPGQAVDGGQTHAAADRQEDREAVAGRPADRALLVGEQDGRLARRRPALLEDGEAAAAAAARPEAAAHLPVGRDAVAQTGSRSAEECRVDSSFDLASAGIAGPES